VVEKYERRPRKKRYSEQWGHVSGVTEDKKKKKKGSELQTKKKKKKKITGTG